MAQWSEVNVYVVSGTWIGESAQGRSLSVNTRYGCQICFLDGRPEHIKAIPHFMRSGRLHLDLGFAYRQINDGSQCSQHNICPPHPAVITKAGQGDTT